MSEEQKVPEEQSVSAAYKMESLRAKLENLAKIDYDLCVEARIADKIDDKESKKRIVAALEKNEKIKDIIKGFISELTSTPPKG